ncbi:PhoX family phosphatase [Coleofasciculus sp. FACHB-T130]|uniref:PhoX family protein n=1 Tax=Cyanophyceae TaxID=3028117 RepID=UPI0016893825|nr:PhoX family phosphatase [Coleofasciculus sp. FACHB-T130]MBD1878262.1 PhoX family phosphatase [Coleofasciculus sp. FACHB-T130]
MSKFSRRQLLIFFGASAGTAVLAPTLGRQHFGSNPNVAQAVLPLKFTPVRLPHPLPIYQEQKSFYATAINYQGSVINASTDTRLSTYNIVDDVVVPPEYERYVIVRWGDRVYPNPEEYFGYNNDYTGFVPLDGRNPNDGYLWVNHEYVSYPFTFTLPEVPEDLAGLPESYPLVVGQSLPGDKTDLFLLGEIMYNMGGSVLRMARQNRAGRYSIVKDPNNRRLHGLSGLGINSQRSDQYKTITSWGSKSYQKGDQNYLLSTGPAATQVFPLSVDGLGNKIIGTAYNCSGGTTPWGTILSAEENFQASTAFFVGVTESVKSDGTQTSYTAGTSGEKFGLVGEKYGWMVEIDPSNPNFRPRKHTALGRYRHENIAMRAEAGKKLVAYMGDDRRGGHTWKFVSKGTVSAPNSKNNSALFEEGTLYVARYNPDGTGTWIPLDLNAATNPIPPSVLGSKEIAALGKASRNGLIKLPRRNGIAGQTTDGGAFNLDTTNEATALAGYQGKKLSNFYTSQGAVLVDAFLAANLLGGTPTARPEDIEVHPRTKDVFIAYTDGAAGSDGYPDSRIFVVSKYSPAVNAGQPSGELFKIMENSSDGTGTTFRWQRFAKGGEAAAEPGSGFANVDNLAFDPQGNIWGVTDMSTSAHNGFDVGAAATPLAIDHRVVGSNSPSVDDSNLNVQTSNLIGVFGNNWLFFIPTTGPDAGEIVPFAYGPPRCELTGPTFIGDTLIISVQHPGEDCPFNPQQTLSRTIEMLDLNGTLFNQQRTVPRGSNWPSNIEGNPQGPPRPSVIGIQRKQSNGTFV